MQFKLSSNALNNGQLRRLLSSVSLGGPATFYLIPASSPFEPDAMTVDRIDVSYEQGQPVLALRGVPRAEIPGDAVSLMLDNVMVGAAPGEIRRVMGLGPDAGKPSEEFLGALRSLMAQPAAGTPEAVVVAYLQACLSAYVAATAARDAALSV